MLVDINPQGSSAPQNFTVSNGLLFFQAKETPGSGIELWKTDGTIEGTSLVKNININGNADPILLTDVENILYFNAKDGISGSELWKSDGSEMGTSLVSNISEFMGSNPEQMISYNGELYFSSTDGITGHELWRSDGSEFGTFLIKDINPQGSSNSSPHWLTVYNNLLYFQSTDGPHGKELWVTDGIEETTHMVADINPVGSCDPSYMSVSNNILFFQANDGVTGHELWKLDLITSVIDFQFEDLIHIFPNPVVDLLSIEIGMEINHKIELKIVDFQGRIIYSEKELNKPIHELNLNHLSPGIYLLNVISNSNNSYSKKFVKM